MMIFNLRVGPKIRSALANHAGYFGGNGPPAKNAVWRVRSGSVLSTGLRSSYAAS